MPDHDLGPLARTALEIRRMGLQHPAQVSFDPAIWPGWWGEKTALRAVAYLRDAGVHDDAVEAGVLLVGCAYHDAKADREITGLGGEVVMATRVLQGRPSDYGGSYWRELAEAFHEHQLARASIQAALLDDAQDWSDTDRRRRKVYGDTVHRVLPLLAGRSDQAAAALARRLFPRLRLLRPAIPVD